MFFLLILIIVILAPLDAMAWGGGIHLQLGAEVLADIGLLKGDVASLLLSHPQDFLYGCLAPDITVGKKYTHYLLNCHRWGMGKTLLKDAKTDRQRACAYGYLAHLAADTVAHNYFVPLKIIGSFPAITMKHAYWEMRFEAFVEKETWELAHTVCSADQESNDELLRGTLTTTIFSFGTSKRIFNSIMAMSRMDRPQKIVQTLSQKSRYLLSSSEREENMELARGAVLAFLGNEQNCTPLRHDPTGEKTLYLADAIRKKLRIRYKSGLMSRGEGMEQVEAIRGMLKKSLYRPEHLKKLMMLV